jgi:hypothetical protein
MKSNEFPHKLSFRLLGPIILGTLVYLLVLMLFDSLALLQENFFSREILFTIILSLLFSELNRGVVLMFRKSHLALRARIIAQFLTGTVITLLGISTALFLYFTYVEGFTVIRTELITFNSIFFIFALFYHAFYFSLMYLDMKNEQKKAVEIELQEKLHEDLKAFKTDINPEFLYHGLEVILKSVPIDPVKTDKLVSNLANIYRYRLKNRDLELAPVKSEIDSMKTLYHLMDSETSLQTEDIDESYYLIPGTLLFIAERAIMNNIAGNILDFTLKAEGDSLYATYQHFPKLRPNTDYENLPDRLQDSYRFYRNLEISESIVNNRCTITIPLIAVETESI